MLVNNTCLPKISISQEKFNVKNVIEDLSHGADLVIILVRNKNDLEALKIPGDSLRPKFVCLSQVKDLINDILS